MLLNALLGKPLLSLYHTWPKSNWVSLLIWKCSYHLQKRSFSERPISNVKVRWVKLPASKVNSSHSEQFVKQRVNYVSFQ